MSLERRLAALERHNAELLRRLDRLPVRFAAGGGGASIKFAILNEDLVQGASAAATDITQADADAAGRDTTGGATITLYSLLLNPDETLTAGRVVAYVRFKGALQVLTANCPPTS